jgi:quercetin dioxygenase-like cupin family protein
VKRLTTALALLCCAVQLVAQQSASGDLTAVAIEQEPRHRLVFANDFVRVLDVFLPPLYVSQNHTHVYDNVAVTILSGAAGPQGQARIGFAGYSRGGYTHVITNPNNAPMRFIAVELRAADHGTGDEEPQTDHVTVLNNAKVRISRVKLTPGEVVPAHHHASGYVSVIVRGGEGPGVWKWHPSNEAPAQLDAGKQALELVEVQPR